MDLFAQAAAVLAANPRVEAAYAFGSRARGDARESSDVDLGVVLGESISLAEELRLRASVVNALARDDVDLVILDHASPVLRHEVLATGRRLFARDGEAADLRETAWQREFLDTAHLREVQRRLMREALQ